MIVNAQGGTSGGDAKHESGSDSDARAEVIDWGDEGWRKCQTRPWLIHEGGLLYVIIVLYIYTLLYPQKVNFFDTLQLDNLDNLGNLMNPKWMLSQAACWTSSLTFEGLHPNCDGRMPIFFQNRFGYDSNKAIAIKKSPSILQAPYWKSVIRATYVELPFANIAYVERCVKRTTSSGGFLWWIILVYPPMDKNEPQTWLKKGIWYWLWTGNNQINPNKRDINSNYVHMSPSYGLWWIKKRPQKRHSTLQQLHSFLASLFGSSFFTWMSNSLWLKVIIIWGVP